jgi:phosphoribosylaminoimidazole (AIR) synthetase
MEKQWRIPYSMLVMSYSFLHVGGISASELLRTFNCGIGAAIIVSASDVEHVLELITCEVPCTVGTVEAQSGEGEAESYETHCNQMCQKLPFYS